MIKYAIELEDGKFLESDQYVDAETDESPMVEKIEDAILFKSVTKAIEVNNVQIQNGYYSRIVEVEVSYRINR